MKKALTLLLVTGFLFACNSGSNDKKSAVADTSIQNHKEHEVQSAGLLLNNGAKWKADSTTLLNVALLQAIVSNVKKESLEDYRQTVTRLQDGLNKMVNECKMKGPDHEALHHWLEPLMEKTKELKNARNIQDAGIISGEIEKQMSLFPKYFEK